MNFKKILIAVDNSTCAERAAKAGYEMATKFDAEIALVNIIDTNLDNIIHLCFVFAFVHYCKREFTFQNQRFVLDENFYCIID